MPDELNAKLNEPYTVEEVTKALFELHSDKAPGMDGFSALFYQRLWQLIKEVVSEEIL